MPPIGIEPTLALLRTGFSYHYSFHYRRLNLKLRASILWSGLYLHHIITDLDAHRQVSTPSKLFQVRLGSVLAFYSLHRIWWVLLLLFPTRHSNYLSKSCVSTNSTTKAEAHFLFKELFYCKDTKLFSNYKIFF